MRPIGDTLGTKLGRTLGASVVALAVAGGALTLAPSAASAQVAQGSDPCATFDTLIADTADLESAPAFDAAGYRALAKNFKAAAKTAPERLQSSMRKIAKFYASVGKAKSDSDAVAAYGRGLVKYDEPLSRFRAYYDVNCGEAERERGSAAGTLTLGGETIGLSVSQCDLREQTIAGQKILWTGRALGTDSAGDDVLVDVTRFDASSFVAGDSVRIGVGDPTQPDFVNYEGSFPADTVGRSGTTLRASGIAVVDAARGTVTASFTIIC